MEVEWARQKDSYVRDGGSFLEYRSKSCAGACVDEAEERVLVWPWRLAIVVLGDVMRLRRPCNVDVEEVGDPAWDAIDSTSSIEFDCHPLFTLIIAL